MKKDNLKYSVDLSKFKKDQLERLTRDSKRPSPPPWFETVTRIEKVSLPKALGCDQIEYQDGVVAPRFFGGRKRIVGDTFTQQAILAKEMVSTLSSWFDAHPFKRWLSKRICFDFENGRHDFWLIEYIRRYVDYRDSIKTEDLNNLCYEVSLCENSISNNRSDDLWSIHLNCRIDSDECTIQWRPELTTNLLDCYSKSTVATSLKKWEKWYIDICNENKAIASGMVNDLQTMFGICEGL